MDLYYMVDLALQGFLPGVFLNAPPLWFCFWAMIVAVFGGIVNAYKEGDK